MRSWQRCGNDCSGLSEPGPTVILIVRVRLESEAEIFMGKRQDVLRAMLAEAGYVLKSKGTHPRPSTANGKINNSVWGEIDRVYRQLGGTLPACPLRPGPWDLELAEFAIELDEEQHFNVYRKITLASPLLKNTGFPVAVYSRYCDIYSDACMIKGTAKKGYWSSPSTVKQFGAGAAFGDLTPPGSPRWKQRAFYDFLKDLSASSGR